jgi:hypothetical protein
MLQNSLINDDICGLLSTLIVDSGRQRDPVQFKQYRVDKIRI